MPSEVIAAYFEALAKMSSPESLTVSGFDPTNDSFWLRSQGSSPTTEA